MLIADLANAGSLPVLSDMMRFTARRQELIAHNIANLDTPDFRQEDLSVTTFQGALAKAVAKRRAAGNDSAPLGDLHDRQSRRTSDGGLSFRPSAGGGGVLFHDRNNRDLEGLMQDLAENGLAFRAAADMYRRQNEMIRVAMTQRV